MEKIINNAIENSLKAASEELSRICLSGVEDKAEDVLKKIEIKYKKAILNIEKLKATMPVRKIQVNSMPLREISSEPVKHIDELVLYSKLGMNILLVGPAGCGKSTSAKQLSEILGLQFGATCLTAGASETWLFGRQTPNGFVEGAFSKLYREGGVFLADEIDAADPNLLLSINTALANGILFNPISGKSFERHKDFIFLGAANTFGLGADDKYTGRMRLDAATLDRFIIIDVDYDSKYETEICPNKELREKLFQARNILKQDDYSEFISTRWFENAYKLKSQGKAVKEIFEVLSKSWSESAKKRVFDSFGWW